MDATEKRRRIAQAHEEDRCPNCWEPLGPGRRTGSGNLADGAFCGQDCQAAFHRDYYLERARASRRSQN